MLSSSLGHHIYEFSKAAVRTQAAKPAAPRASSAPLGLAIGRPANVTLAFDAKFQNKAGLVSSVLARAGAAAVSNATDANDSDEVVVAVDEASESQRKPKVRRQSKQLRPVVKPPGLDGSEVRAGGGLRGTATAASEISVSGRRPVNEERESVNGADESPAANRGRYASHPSSDSKAPSPGESLDPGNTATAGAAQSSDAVGTGFPIVDGDPGGPTALTGTSLPTGVATVACTADAATAPAAAAQQQLALVRVSTDTHQEYGNEDGAGEADANGLILGSADVDMDAVGVAAEEEEEDDEEALDDTAVAISVLAAAAAASAAADGGHPHPHVPPTVSWRRTDTWEPRPLRQPPAVVAFQGGGLRELQALIDSVRGPTIINLQGHVVTLRAGDLEEAASAGGGSGGGADENDGVWWRRQERGPSGGDAGTAAVAAAAAATTGQSSTSLVPSRGLQVPGWSAASEVLSERARMLEGGGAARHRPPLTSPSPPPSQQQQRQQQALGSRTVVGTATDGGCLLLHRDDVTLADGSLQLHRDCRLVVSGRRVALRRVEVVDAEASGWWRLLNAMPATCLQPSALIHVTADQDAIASAASANGNNPPLHNLHHHHQHHYQQQQHPQRRERQQQPMVWNRVSGSAGRGGGGDGGGPSLELDECQVVGGGRDRDLLRVDGGGGGVAVTARYCRLRGGANAVVATLGASLHLDCCVVEGYATAGVVAMESTVRAVGSRLLGAAGSIIGLQAVAGSRLTALGCFLRGHSSNLECLTGSTVDMQGCVLARTDCRHGLTVHPDTHAHIHIRPETATAAATAANPTNRVRLTDCELGHPVRVGGGELELERCTFAFATAVPAAAAQVPTGLTASPELAAMLAAAAAAATAGGGVGGGAGAGWDVGGGFAGTVAAGGSLRVVGCGVGGGGEGGVAVAVVEAAREASVHVSSSPGVLVRRR